MKNSLNSLSLAAPTLAMCAAILCARADYPATVVSQGPVGYWRLNETKGPQPQSLIATNLGTLGTPADAAYAGDQAFFRGETGALASSDLAAAFDGVSQRVQVPYVASLNPNGPWTIEAWLNPATSTPVGNLTCVLASLHSGSPRAGWLIYQSGGLPDSPFPGWQLRLYGQSGLDTSIRLTAGPVPVAGQWHHVVFTFDGTTARGYVNGTLQTNGVPASPGFVPNPDSPFSIGARSDNAFPWAGKADEVAFYGTAMAADQVAAHFAAATTNASGYTSQILALNPLAYFRLNEPGDPPAANLGTLGTAASGSYVYAANPNQTGPAPPAFAGLESNNKACGFDGNSGYVSIRPLNLNTNTVTITCWLLASGDQPANAGVVFSREGTTAAGLKFAAQSGRQLSYDWNNTVGTWESGLTVPDAQWSFAALIISPDQAVVCLHDGASFTCSTNIIQNANQAFAGKTRIGSYAGTGNPTFSGVLDEVAVFNRAFSLGEVYSQYAAAVGNLPPVVLVDPQAPIDSLYETEALHLTVDAGGTPALSYQWRKGGGNLNGATSSTYNVPSLTTSDAGNYDVVIANAFGSVTSKVASITVKTLTPPLISQDPQGRTVYVGGSVNLSIAASGGQLRYQWEKSGAPIAGATNSTYRIAAAASGDKGDYLVFVTNILGMATSGTANVTVIEPAANSYEAAVVADKPEAWWRLDEPVGSVMLLDGMGRHDGTYTGNGVVLGVPGVIATGGTNTAASFDGSQSYGEVPYSPALNVRNFSLECWARTSELGVELSPVSSFQSKRGEFFQANSDGTWWGCIGNDDNFVYYYVTLGDVQPGRWAHLVMTFAATGTNAGLNFYWNGQVFGAYEDFVRNTSGNFLIGAVGPGVSALNQFFKGDIDEVAYYGTTLSQGQVRAHYQAALYGSITAPIFTVQPKTQVVVAGDSVTLMATAEGTLPIRLQWLKGGTPIAGQTNDTLTLSNLWFTDTASYRLRASNSVGTNDSDVAALTVMPQPTFANVTNDLVLHAKFDGDYLDSSGRGNHGTNVGATTFVPGKLGQQALHYSTLTDTGASGGTVTNANYVTLGTPADLQFGSSVNFSVAYWVRLKAGSQFGDLPFFCNDVGSLGGQGYTLAPSYGNGGVAWSLGSVRYDGPDDTINDGSWHHVVNTFDRNGRGITYLDGVQEDSTLTVAAGNLDTDAPTNIGQDNTGAYAESGEADIDDLGVWRRVLNSYEAYSIYYVGQKYGRTFDVLGPVALSLQKSGSEVELVWQAGTLEWADQLTGTWSSVPGATAPYYKLTPGLENKYFRVKL